MAKERKLTVFSPAPYRRWDIYHRILWFFRSINCAWQHATKDYCYRDLWSMDYFYSQFLVVDEDRNPPKDLLLRDALEDKISYLINNPEQLEKEIN
jgi:hypothetical protein